jgi:hypothetical protein
MKLKLKQKAKALAAVLVGSGLLAFAASPALCADEFCPMGGVLIKAEVVKDKALEWGKDRKQVLVSSEGADSWSVLTLSRTDDKIAIQVTAAGAFFGVAGKGGNEVDARDAEKVFGKDFRKLEDAVKKELTDLWKAGVVKIQGADVQLVANALGLGTLEKGRAWELKTDSCKGMDLNTSDLK